MKREPIKSSNIKSVGFDPDTRVMEVEFHGGKVFAYHNILRRDHASLLNSRSIGQHFHKFIRPFHKAKLVPPPR